MGKYVEKFEKNCPLDGLNTVVVNSGSSANLLMIESLLEAKEKKILKKR